MSKSVSANSVPAAQSVPEFREKALKLAIAIKENKNTDTNVDEILGIYIAYTTPLPSSEVVSSGYLLAELRHNCVGLLHELSTKMVLNQKVALSTATKYYQERYSLVYEPAKALYIRTSSSDMDDRAAFLVSKLITVMDTQV